MNLYWQVIETSEEVLKMGKGQSQYYATVDLGETRVGRTRILEGEPRDPVWNETSRIYCAHTVSQIVVSIKDAAIVGTTVVGRAKVPVIDLLSGRHSSFLASCVSFKARQVCNPVARSELIEMKDLHEFGIRLTETAVRNTMNIWVLVVIVIV